MEFNGKRILVSGAGKGIGRATVTFLAAHEAEVVALSRSPADLDELRTETGCNTIAVDLTDAKRGPSGSTRGSPSKLAGQQRRDHRSAARSRH